jgi:hypothetical protein
MIKIIESMITDVVSSTGFLIGLGIVILIVLLIRELVMWYWKINRIVDLLESIDRKISILGSDAKTTETSAGIEDQKVNVPDQSKSKDENSSYGAILKEYWISYLSIFIIVATVLFVLFSSR